MKHEISENLKKNFEDIFDKMEKFDQFFNNGKNESDLTDCKIYFEQILNRVINGRIIEAEKNLDYLAERVLDLIDEEDIKFDKSPVKPCYTILRKKPSFRNDINVVRGFMYKKHIMNVRKINNIEFYCHVKFPHGIWSIKLQYGENIIIAFPSTDGYYYIDDYYSCQTHVSSKNISSMLFKRFKIDGIYQCWKLPDCEL